LNKARALPRSLAALFWSPSHTCCTLSHSQIPSFRCLSSSVLLLFPRGFLLCPSGAILLFFRRAYLLYEKPSASCFTIRQRLSFRSIFSVSIAYPPSIPSILLEFSTDFSFCQSTPFFIPLSLSALSVSNKVTLEFRHERIFPEITSSLSFRSLTNYIPNGHTPAFLLCLKFIDRAASDGRVGVLYQALDSRLLGSCPFLHRNNSPFNFV